MQIAFSRTKSVLIELLDLVVGNGFSETNFVVISIEDSVVSSHENVTDEEHLLGDIHSHDGGCTLVLSSSCLVKLLVLVGLSFDLGVGSLKRFELVNFRDGLSHHLWTKRSHSSVLHLRSSLSHLNVLSWEHPLVIVQFKLLTSDNER